jgi:hypothetical protein
MRGGKFFFTDFTKEQIAQLPPEERFEMEAPKKSNVIAGYNW